MARSSERAQQETEVNKINASNLIKLITSHYSLMSRHLSSSLAVDWWLDSNWFLRTTDDRSHMANLHVPGVTIFINFSGLAFRRSMEDALFPSSKERLTLGPDECRLLDGVWRYRGAIRTGQRGQMELQDGRDMVSQPVKALAWAQIALGEGTDFFLHLPSNLLIIPVRNELSKCCDPTARE